MRTLFWVTDVPLCPHVVEGARELWDGDGGDSFMGALVLSMASLPVLKRALVPLGEPQLTTHMFGKSLQSCLTLCNSIDRNPPGSSVHWILQGEYWSGLPCPPLGDLPDPEIKPTSLMYPAIGRRVLYH